MGQLVMLNITKSEFHSWYISSAELTDHNKQFSSLFLVISELKLNTSEPRSQYRTSVSGQI